MTETTVQAATSLVDRRSYGTAVPPLVERRQFGNSYEELSAPARAGSGDRRIQTAASSTLHQL